MSANQLLEKALSTASEDEAIACLRMARKKGLKLVTSTILYDDSRVMTHLKSLNAERYELRSELLELRKYNEFISDELANYKAGLVVTIISACLLVVFALVV